MIFFVFVDIIVDCDEVNDLIVIGEFMNVVDNCDFVLVVIFLDVVIDGLCVDDRMIWRIWWVVDVCGNFIELD